MRKSLLQIYGDLRESDTTSEFPYLLGNTMHKELLARFNGFASPWRQYCKVGQLSDFKAHDRIILSEAPDLLKVTDSSGYKGSKMSDAKYSLQADTWGRLFTVTRRQVINDDTGGIMQMPGMYGRAAVRTLVKAILFMIKGGQKSYDGKALFNVDHNNYIDTALANTAAGMAAVAQAMVKVESAKEPNSNEPMGIKAKYILTGVTLGPIVEQLIKSAQILPVSTNGGGTYNSVSRLVPLVDPLIDTELSTTFWAVLADPAECPVVEVGFINGQDTPELLVQKPTVASVAGGGDDPYGYEFDELTYKTRWDFGVQLGYYQGICRGKA